MKYILRAVFAVLAIWLLFPFAVAFADTVATTTAPVTVAVTATTPAAPPVVVPYGDAIKWLFDNFQTLFVTLLMALATWALAKFPTPIANVLKSFLTEQLLRSAINYAINAVEGATSNGQLSIPVGSAVVANAVNYAIAHGPTWLLNWMGGVDGITSKIFGRLNLVPEATVATVAPAAAVPAVVPVPSVPKT